MSVNTSTPTDDDSGAFGVLLNGNETVVAYNTISGHDAFSYDYGRDGCAIEIYAGRDNVIHHNEASDNDCFASSETPGRPTTSSITTSCSPRWPVRSVW